MSGNSSSQALAARRQLGFLSTFDKKFEGFRREMERLRRASVTGKSFGGRWPTEGLERIARSLVGAGAVYNLPDVAEWARQFLARLDAIRVSPEPPSAGDLDWLATEIGGLNDLYTTNLAAARESAGDAGPAAPVAPKPLEKAKPEPPAPQAPRPDATPFIAPSRTTDPPPPPAKPEPPAPPPTPPAKPAPSRPRKPSAPDREPSAALRPVVLVAAEDQAVRDRIAFSLKNAGFDTREVSSAEELLRRAVEESPELIVIDVDDPPPAGKALAAILAGDPLTDFVPLVKVGTLDGPPRGNEIPKPIDAERFLAVARRVATPEIRAARVTIGLCDPTLAEVLDFVGDELRAGVLDSATGDSTSQRIRIPSEGKLMAAIWGLVAQIRRAAAEGTRGKIRFLPATSGQLGMMALAEAEDVLDASFTADVTDADVAALGGTRAVVADDDPEIRAVFERVLTEAGVRVRLSENGRDALESVRFDPPDFVISDILMPEMDGWELCNRLRADYALRHVPVILLSWKEDFLERLRGLNVDANDFMLKEVDRKQIVGRVVRVLRPRLVLERQLGIHGDVTGRIERLGVTPILASAAKLRPSCRVSFRETWNYFEADIRDGELIAVTRTGTDGTFASGAAALERLLGVTSGRFAVVEPVDTPRRQFSEGARGAIEAACRRLNGLVAQITDGALIDIAKVDVEPEVQRLYAQIMPPKLRVPLERLAAGTSPREIILAQEASPDALESLLLDLVRVGAITGIAAPPPNLERTPIARDSARWRALADGRLIEERDEPDPAPATKAAPLPSLIPLAPEDLDEVDAPPPAASRTAPLPPLPRAPRSGTFAAWKALAVVALLFLGFSLFFNYRLWQESGGSDGADESDRSVPSDAPDLRPPPAPEPAPATPPEPEAVAPATPPEPEVAAPPTPPEPEVAPPVAQPEPKEEEKADTKADKADKADKPDHKSDRKSDKADKPDKADQKTDKADKKADKADKADKAEKSDKSDQKSDKADTGRLSVSVPPDAPGPVAVSVDGTPRGNAPVSIELPVGLHEVTFTSGGERNIRMVSIKPGETKSVAAKVAP